MTDVIQEYNISEFRGSFPDVPIADGVDLEALKESNATAFFVTLPIVPEIGAVSKNGLLYDDALVNSIEEQINTKRPGGIFGHLKDEDRDTAFPLPSGMWIGAKREGNTLWAKAWIPNGKSQDYLRQLKAVGGRIATSIYGKHGGIEQLKDGAHRLKSFTLESLDFAPPERAALGYGAMPHLTTELEQPTAGEDNDMDKSQVLAELTVNEIPAPLRDAIVTEYKKQNDQSGRIAELETALAGTNGKLEVAEATIAEFSRREFEATVDAKVMELIDWKSTTPEAEKAVNSLRKMLRGQIKLAVGDERAPARVAELIAGVWEDFKPVAEQTKNNLAGPRAIVAGRQRGDNKFELDMSPEAVRASVAKFSVTV